MANNLTRFDPFSDIMRARPFRDVGDLFRDFPYALRRADEGQSIRLDIAETDQEYTIKAEVPGVKKDDIKVSVGGNQVSISAEIKKEDEHKDGATMYSERYWGQQYRSFTLPQEVDETQAVAKYEDGILQLTLPKKAGGQGKQLAIQ